MVKKTQLKKLKKVSSISAFFPCYNDAGSIGLMVKNAEKVLKKTTPDFEIIVIDDASRDESRKILESLKSEISNLKIILHKINKGYGGALKSGFKAASKDLVFYTDGDGQYDAREMVNLFSKLKDDIDIVQGYKIKRLDSWYRVFLGRVYHHLAKFLFGLKIRDVDCDFRLIRRRALKTINLEYNSGVVCVELVKKLQDKNFKFAEVGVNHFARAYGHSQYFNYKRVIKTLIELSQLWMKLVVFKKVQEI